MTKRKPQINFQVDEPMKLLYEEAKASGHWVTRFCTAGFLLMVHDPKARQRAISQLRDWEIEFEKASPTQIRLFVEGARDAMKRGARGSRPARATRRSRKTAKRR